MFNKKNPMRYFSGSTFARLPLYKLAAGGTAVALTASIGLGAFAAGVTPFNLPTATRPGRDRHTGNGSHAHAVAVPHAQPYAGAGPHPDHGGHRRAAGRRRDALRGPAARSHSNAGTHGSAVCVAQGWRVGGVRG